MKRYFQNFPHAESGFFAIPLLVCIVIMGQYFPEETVPGYGSFIVAFEFVESASQVNLLLGILSPEGLKGMDIGNYIDYVFMLVYSAFLFSFWKRSFQFRGGPTLRFGYLLIGLALIGDALENVQLLALTTAYERSATFQPFLDRLQIFTWVKWEALAILFAGISTVMLSRGVFSKIIGALLLVPFLLSLGAFGGTAVQVGWFTQSIFVAFLLLVIYCFTYKPANT